MKTLPKGNYALSIAHPGHEVRLYGFIEQTKPFIYILTDGGDPVKIKKMYEYLGSIYRDTRDKRDVFYMVERKPEKDQQAANESLELKDYEIIDDLQAGRTGVFEFYIKKMANSFIFNKIDYVVVDPAEEYDAVHDINRVLTDAAIELVKLKTGKEITVFDFNISYTFNHDISEDCILVELLPEQGEKKLRAILNNHESLLSEFKNNITIDEKVIKKYLQAPDGYAEIKKLIMDNNPDFFRFEYLKPAKEVAHSETYNALIVPLKEKLFKFIATV